jgi:hypothetical protein
LHWRVVIDDDDDNNGGFITERALTGNGLGLRELPTRSDVEAAVPAASAAAHTFRRRLTTQSTAQTRRFRL